MRPSRSSCNRIRSFGGTMNHPIVPTNSTMPSPPQLLRLRFNFRGSGQSGLVRPRPWRARHAARRSTWAQSSNPDSRTCWIRRLFSLRAWIWMPGSDAPAGDRMLHLDRAAGHPTTSRSLSPGPSRGGLISHGEKDALVPPKDFTVARRQAQATQNGISSIRGSPVREPLLSRQYRRADAS